MEDIADRKHEHDHEHHHEHNHSDVCEAGSCKSNGCGDNCGHDHEKKSTNVDYILWAVAVLFFITALFPIYEPIRTILFGLSALLAGYDIFIEGFKELFTLKLKENSLLLIAVVASFVLGEFAETCVVTLLFKLGEFLESYAIAKSKKSMETLAKIRPDYATVKDANGGFVSAKAETVSIGDIIYLRAGDKVALDCTVISGSSSIDGSALTGESVPISAEEGDELLSGSINLSGLLEARVTKSFENSTASQIIKLVYESSLKKGKAENFISRFARIYTPIVTVLAVLIAVVPPLLSLGSFHDYIMRALVFLVASCPCSLVISIPLSFFSGIGAASKIGVLIKGSMYMEKLAKVKAVCFDKTGTITNGKLSVDSVVPVDGGTDKDNLLLLAARLEETSNHPIAQSIVEYAGAQNRQGIERLNFSSLSETAGMGISGVLDDDGSLYRCGGINMLKKAGIQLGELPLANVYICKDENIIGYITLKEEIPNSSLTVAAELSDAGVNTVVMLTGDNEASAAAVAKKCGITEYYSGLLPIDKVKKVETIKAKGDTLLFVGDGINDAPVLASADVGMSMGFGSEVANASSDIVLTSNSLSTIPKAIALAKRSMGIVHFNLIFAFVAKAIVLTLGATGYGTMWLAVIADVGVTILSVLNAIRILRVKR